MSKWYQSLGGYNPTSGSYLYNQGGTQMLDAPWLQSPVAFSGTNYASNANQQRGNNAPTPRIQNTMKQQGIQITPAGSRNSSNQIQISGGTGPTEPSRQAAPKPAQQAAPQPVQTQMNDQRERLEMQRQQREEQARRFSQSMDQDYQRGLQSQLDSLGSRLGGYTINDLSAINSAQRQIDLLNNQASNYRSDTSSGINLSGAEGYNQLLGDLLNERQAEQGRFDQFSSGINTGLSDYGDYTVNSDLDAAERSLRDMLLSAQNYDTALNVDLNSPMSRIQFAMDDIDRLGQDRTRQQGIIDTARGQAENNLSAFGAAYTDVDYRNAQELDRLTGQLDDVVNPNLNVDLAYDFSDLSGQVDPYREIVADMRNRRMRDLDGLGGDIGQIGDALGGFFGSTQTRPDGSPVDTTMPIPEGIIDDKPIPDGMPQNNMRDIQSASEVYDIRDRLGGALDTLSSYGIGDRSNELRGQLFAQDEQYAQLADQLRGRQGQVETDAQAQLDALAEARMTRPDDIRSFEQALQDLSGQRDLFDAGVASDELQRLTDQIASQRSDLERDEAARIARQELERRRAMQVAGGNQFNNQFVSPEDYSAYLRALELGREDDYYKNVGTGFSRALGLA